MKLISKCFCFLFSLDLFLLTDPISLILDNLVPPYPYMLVNLKYKDWDKKQESFSLITVWMLFQQGSISTVF